MSEHLPTGNHPSNRDDTFREIVTRFEEAYRTGSRPNLADYLTQCEDRRHDLLIELAHLELQYRMAEGEATLVESLFRQFPELENDSTAAIELITAEYELRQSSATIAEYQQRFPRYQDQLSTVLQPAPPLPGLVGRAVRVNCPHCLSPMEVGANDSPDSIGCPECGERFQLDVGKTPTWTPSRLPRLGHFQLLEPVGSGAFGTVYRARDERLQRIVAVKVPRQGRLASKLDEERFEREARSVAQLQHPGIIPVYEVGRTRTFSYIVSEFVEGMTLAEAMSARRFGFRESAELVAAVAHSLQHSHTSGIVHRDVKPSNIMLQVIRADHESRRSTTVSSRSTANIDAIHSGDGQTSYRPRLMDFGLARCGDHDITVTLEGQVLGTPAYMSPEQAQGDNEQVDARSDLYSVGVVLYELLCRELPFRGNHRMLMHQVMHTEPPSPRRLNDRIPRDLETICLKCLAKERSSRYADAGSLAADLTRYLDGDPIEARPLGAAERCWRWCRRRPAVASLLSLLLLAVVSGMALVTWQWRRAEANLESARLERKRAEANFETLREASDDMMDLFQQWLTRMPEHEAVRDELLRRSVALYERLLSDQPANAAVQHEIAIAHQRVAHIRRMLGDHELAVEHFRLAIDAYRQLADASSHDPLFRRKWADSSNWLGETLRMDGRADDAENAYRAAISEQVQLADEFPEQPEYGGDLCRSYYNLGLALGSAGRLTEAEDLFRTAIERLDRLVDRHPSFNQLRQDAARCHINLGNLLFVDRMQEANAEYRRAIALLEGLVRLDKDDPEYRYEFATAQMNRANLLFQNRDDTALDANPLGQAESLYRKSIAVLAELSTEYSGIPKYRKELANSFNGLASVQQVSERATDARESFETSTTHLTELVQRHPDSSEYHSLLAVVLGNLARIVRDEGELAAAKATLEQAITHQQRAIEISPHDTNYSARLYNHRRSLAIVLIGQADHASASEQAELLPPLAVDDWQGWFRAARFLAQCALLAAGDDRLENDIRQARVDAYAARAIGFLEEAIEHGLSDASRLRDTQDLAPLANREAYRRLVTQLESR